MIIISLSGLVGSSHHHDGFQYLYTGTSSIDLINFGGNFSLELLRFGKSWQETLRNVKLKKKTHRPFETMLCRITKELRVIQMPYKTMRRM